MKKRLLVSALWFFAMWNVGALIADLFGFSQALAPILGVAAALIIGVDPRGILWNAPAKSTPSAPQARIDTIQTQV